MEKDPRLWVNALRSSHDALVRRVRSLSAEDLTRPSYCPGWDVSQVVSHIGSGAEIVLLGLERAVDGRPAPARADFPAIWDRWNAMAPEERAREMVVWDRRSIAVAESLDDATLSSLRLDMFGTDLDAVAVIGLRLAEHTLHSWDVAVVFDDQAELLADAVDLLVDRVPRVAGRTGRAEEMDGPKQVDVRTYNPTRHMVLSLGDGVDLEPDGEGSSTDGPVDARLSLPSAALVRLVYGRLDPAHTPAGTVTEGGVDLDQLRRVFPGF